VFRGAAKVRIVLAGVWIAALVVRATLFAQAPQTPPAQIDTKTEVTRSTQSGVYTAEQAKAGAQLFGNICQGCHNIGSQSGEVFAKRWNGALLADLWETLTTEMPKDDPGSLTPPERVQMIAYLLKLNGMPEGKEALPADVDVLKKIKIQTQ
jgi:mono/diheme cytochrome c family protein